VISPAFVTDCVETLEEIDQEGRHDFLAAGGEQFTYIPCLNDDDAHIAFLQQRAEEEIRGWL
jgi:ferrochelatase